MHGHFTTVPDWHREFPDGKSADQVFKAKPKKEKTHWTSSKDSQNCSHVVLNNNKITKTRQ